MSLHLIGPGQPLDIARYFLILPDDIDMVASQHTMLPDSHHVDRLRPILGTSMDCMKAFVPAETFSGALAPFARLPAEIGGRIRYKRYPDSQEVNLG